MPNVVGDFLEPAETEADVPGASRSPTIAEAMVSEVVVATLLEVAGDPSFAFAPLILPAVTV